MDVDLEFEVDIITSNASDVDKTVMKTSFSSTICLT